MRKAKLYLITITLLVSFSSHSQASTWDMDGNDNIDALTDGLLLLRHTFGLRGDALIDSAMANDSPLSPAQVEQRIADAYAIADIDNNGEVDALTDALILLRYLFGLRGDALIASAVAENGSRASSANIEQYIIGHMSSDNSDSDDTSDTVSGVAVIDEAFGGATFDGETFTFPSGAEAWAGFANMNADLYPFTFSNGGSLSFTGAAPSGGSVNVRFRFEFNPHPDVDPAYDTQTVTVSGADEASYSISIPSQGNNTFSSLIMYVLDRDAPVTVSNVVVTSDGGLDDSVPYDIPRQGLIDGASIWQLPNSPDGDRPDQSWLAVGSDADGEIYISGHDHSQNSMMYRLFQEDQTLRYIGDARTASQAVNNWENGETAEKFHTRPIHHNNQVYVATLDSSSMNNSYLNTRGFHWYGYDIGTEVFSDLSAAEPNGVGGDHLQIVTIQKDPINNLLYGMTIPENKLVQYDIETGQTTVLGKPSAWQGFFYSNRYMWLDSRGRVYISGGSSRNQWYQGESSSIFDHIWFYDPDTGFGELQNFALQGANAMEVGQWERTNKRLYVSDDQGHIYRFTDANSSWEFLGRPAFSSSLKTWVFQLSADEEKIYIGLSDGNQPNAIYEYDIASGTSFELLKISDLDNQAAIEDFITGYDSWDSQGSFYISNFSMYDGDNSFMLGINPVRIKVAKGILPELVQVTAQAGNNEITLSRTGQTTGSLEVLYAIKGYDSDDNLVAQTFGTATISAGQTSVAINPASLVKPESNLIVKRNFNVIPDGNDYVTGDQREVEISN
jgi:hypothetical protein